MQANTNNTSAWQRLKNNELDCEQALKLLLDESGTVNQTLLDKDVSSRFLRHFPDKDNLPPVRRKGRGCSMCFNSGFLGREAVVELIDIDDRIREIIYEGTMTQLHQYLCSINFASFRTAAIIF